MRQTVATMKNIFDVLLLVSTKRWPISMLLLIMSNGKRLLHCDGCSTISAPAITRINPSVEVTASS